MVEILLCRQMYAVRSNVADRCDSVRKHLPLNVEIPLHLIRGRVHAVVIAVRAAQSAIVWDDGAAGARHVGPREWELNNRIRSGRLRNRQKWRLEPMIRVARVKDAVKHTKSCSNRRFMIREWIPSHANTRVK